MENAPLICQDGASVMRMSKGRVRIQVEDLGPAEFNRYGEPLSSKQVLSLAKQILREQGFASYRYDAGWCHTPPADDKYLVYRHAARLSAEDPVLPTYPKRALYGVFRKNHLVAFLQLLKLGGRAHGGSDEIMAVPPGEAWDDLRDVLANGITMELFDYADVQKRKQAFLHLMASDNLDASFSLRDDEFSVMVRLAQHARGTQVRSLALGGADATQARNLAVEQVRRQSPGRWSSAEMGHMWNFAVTTHPNMLDFMLRMARFLLDAGGLRITSWFWKRTGEMDYRSQGVRLLLVARILSSEELGLFQAPPSTAATHPETAHTRSDTRPHGLCRARCHLQETPGHARP